MPVMDGGSERTGLMAVAFVVMWFWFFVFPVGSGLLAARKRRSIGAWVALGVLLGLVAFVVLLVLPTLPDVDPARPHRDLLGMERDGQVAHEAPSARDHERWRGTALVGQAWTLHRVWARQWLRDFDAEVLRLYERLLHVTPPVTPSTAAKGSVRAWCGGPLAAITRFCDRCGAPAGVPTDPAPPATAKSQG